MDPVVLSAVISAAGVLLSAIVAWITAVRSAKITAKSEIDKLKMELSHEDKVRAETIAREQEQAIREQYDKMISAVNEYINYHDLNYRTKAQNAVLSLPATKNERVNGLVKKVWLAIDSSNAFEGPKDKNLSEYLDEIRIEISQ